MINNDEEKKKFMQALSRATTTQTHNTESAFMTEANSILRELGQELGKETEGARHGSYLGSMAVHIYELKTTQTRIFITQAGATLNNVPETITSIACDELQLEAMKRYGRGPRKEKKS